MKLFAPLILLCFFLTGIRGSYAQQLPIDSVLLEINNAETDSAFIIAVNYHIRALERQAPDKFETYSEMAMGVAEESQDSSVIGLAYMIRANWFSYQQWYRKTREMAMQAVPYLEGADRKNALATAYMMIGTTHRHSGKYEDAIDYMLKASHIGIEINDPRIMAGCFNTLGIIYHHLSQSDKSHEYFDKALKVFEDLNSERNIAKLNNNLAIIYRNEGDLEKAHEAMQKSLSIWEKLGDERSKSVVYHNLGVTYTLEKKWDLAHMNIMKAVKIREKYDDKRGMAESYEELAYYHVQREEYDNALTFATKAMAVARKNQFDHLSVENMRLFSTIYAGKEDYKNAYQFLQDHTEGADSVYRIQNTKTIEHMESEYELELAQFELDAQAQEAAIRNQKLKRQELEQKNDRMVRYVLFVGIGLILLFALFVVNRLRITRKQKTIIESRKQEVEEQKRS